MWSPDTGQPFTDETIKKIIETSSVEWCSGLSILGGEPTAKYNIEAALKLAKEFKKAYPNKDIWAWSGRYIEEIANLKHGREFLEAIDILVDRPICRGPQK